MGVTTFSTEKIKQINDLEYNSLKRHISNENYTDVLFNTTVENVEYKNSIFKNVTFSNLEFNHVKFINCTFDETEFTNVKSSITAFKYSIIKDCK